MTDEEFAAIKARWRWNLVDALPTGSQAKMDVRALCDHVERLRAFVREVAGDHQHEWDAVDPQEVWYCTVCGEHAQDWAQYIDEKARALLNT